MENNQYHWTEKSKELRNSVEKFINKNQKVITIVQNLGQGSPSQEFKDLKKELINQNKLKDVICLNLFAANWLMKEKNLRGEAKSLIEDIEKMIKSQAKYDHTKLANIYKYTVEMLLNYHRDEGWAGSYMNKIINIYYENDDSLNAIEPIIELAEQYCDSNKGWSLRYLKKARGLLKKAANRISDKKRTAYINYLDKLEKEKRPNFSNYRAVLRGIYSLFISMRHLTKPSHIDYKTGNIIDI